MAQHPKLYGKGDGFSMVWEPEPNVTITHRGPTLCRGYFGELAKTIENFARHFAADAYLTDRVEA